MGIYSIPVSRSEQLEKSAGGRLNAGLSALFPWLKIGADMEAWRAATSGRQGGQSITLQPIDSAGRQLIQLSLHYLVNQPERICVVSQDTSLPGAEAIAASPPVFGGVAEPRPRRDSIYFHHIRNCWACAVSLGYKAGKRVRKTGAGRTKTAVKAKLGSCARRSTTASGPARPTRSATRWMTGWSAG